MTPEDEEAAKAGGNNTACSMWGVRRTVPPIQTAAAKSLATLLLLFRGFGKLIFHALVSVTKSGQAKKKGISRVIMVLCYVTMRCQDAVYGCNWHHGRLSPHASSDG